MFNFIKNKEWRFTHRDGVYVWIIIIALVYYNDEKSVYQIFSPFCIPKLFLMWHGYKSSCFSRKNVL